MYGHVFSKCRSTDAHSSLLYVAVRNTTNRSNFWQKVLNFNLAHVWVISRRDSRESRDNHKGKLVTGTCLSDQTQKTFLYSLGLPAQGWDCLRLACVPPQPKHGCKCQGTTPSSSWHFFEQTSFCRILIYTFFSGHKMWDEHTLNPSAFRVHWLGRHCLRGQVCARPYPPVASRCRSCLWHLFFKVRVLWPTVLRQPCVRQALSQGCRYFQDAIGTRQWIIAISLLWARNLFLATW